MFLLISLLIFVISNVFVILFKFKFFLTIAVIEFLFFILIFMYFYSFSITFLLSAITAFKSVIVKFVKFVLTYHVIIFNKVKNLNISYFYFIIIENQKIILVCQFIFFFLLKDVLDICYLDPKDETTPKSTVIFTICDGVTFEKSNDPKYKDVDVFATIPYGIIGKVLAFYIFFKRFPDLANKKITLQYFLMEHVMILSGVFVITCICSFL